LRDEMQRDDAYSIDELGGVNLALEILEDKP
jgi:hypothetical protein